MQNYRNIFFSFQSFYLTFNKQFICIINYVIDIDQWRLYPETVDHRLTTKDLHRHSSSSFFTKLATPLLRYRLPIPQFSLFFFFFLVLSLLPHAHIASSNRHTALRSATLPEARRRLHMRCEKLEIQLFFFPSLYQLFLFLILPPMHKIV